MPVAEICSKKPEHFQFVNFAKFFRTSIPKNTLKQW